MPRRAAVLAALAGVLLAASFPPLDLGVLAWFCLLPLLFVLRGISVQRGFWLGGLSGIVSFTGTLYWIAHSVHVYGEMPLVPASLLILLLCAYCSLYPALFGAAVVLLRQRHPRLVLFAAPALWTALELGRTHVITGFPWALLGYTQYRFLPVIQIADVVGVYGLSFLVALANTALEAFLHDRRDRVPLLTALALIGIVLAYGATRLHGPEGASQVRVAVVQGNIEQDKKWDPAYQAEVLSTYEQLTAVAVEHTPDLVVWPETATPFYFGGTGERDAELTAGLRQFVRTAGVPLLTGSPTYEQRGRRYILKNSAFLFDRDGSTEAVYHKVHLVPFGEYIPLKSSILFFAEKLVDSVGDFEAGKEHTIMRIPGARADAGVGTVICYEIIFPGLVRQFVHDGASVMITITNDAWFGRTGAPYQHFAMAVLRAVENRVPVARAANTGISGFIDAQGRILDASDIFTEAVLVRDLVPGTTRTFYTRYGDVFAWLCLAASVVLLTYPGKNDPPRKAPDEHS